MANDRNAEMGQIAREVEDLKSSPLYAYRVENKYMPVIGDGSLTTSIMLIGEAPGKTEAKTGKPFVGQAGKVLAELLASVGLERQDVYITNIVKDRPPENRDPSPEEIRLYSPFLVRQIEIICPKAIATLGRFSMSFILDLFNLPERDQKISVLHGKVLTAEASFGALSIVPLFHPAVALYNRGQRETLERDFQILLQFV